MERVEWIVFDLGGVVLRVDQRNIFKELAACTEMPADVVRARLMAAKDFWGRHGIVETSDDQFHSMVCTALGCELRPEESVAALNSELGAEIESTVGLMRELKTKRKLACLSNTNSTHWRALTSEYSCMDLFDRRLASHELGLAKPDLAIYRRAAELLGAPAASLVFIDDKAENVDAAIEAGWKGHHYQDEKALRDYLTDLGVLERIR